ncbi:MAG: hypothetical protein R2762_00295 [Bryobacteraceae bacterium]
MDEVKLKILPGGDVCDAVGVLLGEIGHGLQLFRVHAAVGNLDALHAGGIPKRIGPLGTVERECEFPGRDTIVALSVVVALAVCAAPQAGFGEDLLVDLTLFPRPDFVFVDVEFTGEGGGYAITEVILPEGIGGLHGILPKLYRN